MKTPPGRRGKKKETTENWSRTQVVVRIVGIPVIHVHPAIVVVRIPVELEHVASFCPKCIRSTGGRLLGLPVFYLEHVRAFCTCSPHPGNGVSFFFFQGS